MLNFTVGPVMSNQDVLDIGAKQVPYFRTPEFSKIMLENEDLMKKFAKASDDSRVVFITGSGTASMEAVLDIVSFSCVIYTKYHMKRLFLKRGAV